MKCQRCQQSDAEATTAEISNTRPGPSGAGNANQGNELSWEIIDWTGNVVQRMSTSTANTPQRNRKNNQEETA